jgi:aminoglycoside phosphotransferase (APT) family kinase protein
VVGELAVDLISGGRSNLTFKAYDDKTSWVVRRPPTTGLTPTAHDMNREWKVTSALQDTAVPVARTVAFDPEGSVLGAPCTVVAFTPGRIVRDHTDLDDLSDDDIDRNTTELVRVLTQIHQVDYAAVGLSDFGRPDRFLRRQVRLWSSQWDKVKTRELEDVDRLHSALEEAIPQTSAASIVHGDYRVDNVILGVEDVGTISAVVDWELSTLGDPLTDVALMCVYRAPVLDQVLGFPAAWTSDRYPSPDSLAERYAQASGRDLTNWNFYLALANFKLGIIAEGITHRALAGAGSGNGAEKAAEATAEFIATGLRAIGGGPR